MSWRRTEGIVTDSPTSKPRHEADVIMTAAALGLAADYIATTRQPLQFDMDPLDAGSSSDPSKRALFYATVSKIDAAVAAYLKTTGHVSSQVRAGLSPGYWPGAMIMGVYALAGHEAQRSGQSGAASPPLEAPVLSPKGQALWDKIRTVSPTTPQYTGRGAYTGFVDNKNTEGDTDPVGPRSTARLVAPAPGVEAPTVVPFGDDPTLGGVLIVDAVTLHDSELNRISRTLR